jgi:hypothetical protein
MDQPISDETWKFMSRDVFRWFPDFDVRRDVPPSNRWPTSAGGGKDCGTRDRTNRLNGTKLANQRRAKTSELCFSPQNALSGNAQLIGQVEMILQHFTL